MIRKRLARAMQLMRAKEAVFDFSSKHWPIMLSAGVLVALFCLRAWALKKQHAAEYDSAHPIFKPSDHRLS